jgi:surface antigen
VRILRVLPMLAALLAGCTTISRDPQLYAALSDDDVEMAASTVQATLERAPDGVARSWSNAATGHGGSVTPIRTYIASNGRFCREYREVLSLGQAEGRFLHTACRRPDEGWAWL